MHKGTVLCKGCYNKAAGRIEMSFSDDELHTLTYAMTAAICKGGTDMLECKMDALFHKLNSARGIDKEQETEK